VPGDATGLDTDLLLRGVDGEEVRPLVHDDVGRQLRQGPGSPAGRAGVPALGDVEELAGEQRLVLRRVVDPASVERAGLVIDDPVAAEQWIERRLGLDLLRERSVRGLASTTGTLHRGRADCPQ
jgi:hypothetical protein